MKSLIIFHFLCPLAISKRLIDILMKKFSIRRRRIHPVKFSRIYTSSQWEEDLQLSPNVHVTKVLKLHTDGKSQKCRKFNFPFLQQQLVVVMCSVEKTENLKISSFSTYSTGNFVFTQSFISSNDSRRRKIKEHKKGYLVKISTLKSEKFFLSQLDKPFSGVSDSFSSSSSRPKKVNSKFCHRFSKFDSSPLVIHTK